jgi:hypothetical protein
MLPLALYPSFYYHATALILLEITPLVIPTILASAHFARCLSLLVAAGCGGSAGIALGV